jgi:hypothetical protein
MQQRFIVIRVFSNLARVQDRYRPELDSIPFNHPAEAYGHAIQQCCLAIEEVRKQAPDLFGNTGDELVNMYVEELELHWRSLLAERVR